MIQQRFSFRKLNSAKFPKENVNSAQFPRKTKLINVSPAKISCKTQYRKAVTKKNAIQLSFSKEKSNSANLFQWKNTLQLSFPKEKLNSANSAI